MIGLSSKKTEKLLPTDILFQTRYWAQVKSRLGCTPMAFDLVSSKKWGDVLVLLQPFGLNKTLAYVPQGPEYAPAEENYGPFLEDFSIQLSRQIGNNVAFIRYDLPWKSQYAEEMRNNEWNEFPESRLRELRMNMGTRNWNIRKSWHDMTVASSLVVDLAGQEENLLARMKPKTRYNIGLARRKGVTVNEVGADRLEEFHALYSQTARRNGFSPGSYRCFAALFKTRLRRQKDARILFLLARHKTDTLAGAIVAISRTTATFLYGASGDAKRNFMAPYLMHWEGMLRARKHGCVKYEMGAVSPGVNAEHPFHGLYRFKTGFGGRIELRCGSWDYPLNHAAYRDFCNAESLGRHRPE